jgi:ubiquinone biosynthesis monooxygenase Coq7
MDALILGLDKALKVISGRSSSFRPNPAAELPDNALKESERRHSAALMRINHVGEVCAQALYDAQGRFSTNISTKQQFVQAGREEEDHLAWTAERLRELRSRPSLLNPFWYAGSYALGAVAAHMGDRTSLGFVVETERQVEAHLASHLESLPMQDVKSRAIVEQMRSDEAAHGITAQGLGAKEMPELVRTAMKVMAKVMTSAAYYL